MCWKALRDTPFVSFNLKKNTLKCSELKKKNTVQEKAGRRKQLREKKNKKLKPKQMYLSSQVSSLL